MTFEEIREASLRLTAVERHQLLTEIANSLDISVPPLNELQVTPRTRKIMAMANQVAIASQNESIDLEHILFAIVKEGSSLAARVLGTLADNSELQTGMASLIVRGAAPVAHGKKTSTANAKQAVQIMIGEARQMKSEFVGVEHLLLGLMSIPNTPVVEFLNNRGITIEKVRRAIEQAPRTTDSDAD